MFYKTKSGNVILDTIHLEADGSFYFQTHKVKEPCVASIQEKGIQINNFFVAPGYNLTITGNAENYLSLFKSKKISGIGAESNAFRFNLDSITAARADGTFWLDLDDKSLLDYVSQQKELQDSLAKSVFNKKPIQDKYLKYFETMVYNDIFFQRMYMLLAHVNMNNYNPEKSYAYIYNNIEPGILQDMYNDKYMISSYYREFIIIKEWITFLLSIDHKKRSNQDKDLEPLVKVNTVYSDGLVKDFALSTLISGAIYNSKSFAQLNKYKEEFEPFITSIKTQYYVNEIKKHVLSKEEDLVKTQIGKPAPAFSLQNNEGQIYSLQDFRGKVIYLDLWASWCGPCREEIPEFKKLTQKFKNENRIIFIGIAVNDGYENWKKALEKDKPTWLQLIDNNSNIVWNSYVANSIPRYVLIDKKGNIADFDAPRPSEKEKIEKILQEEIVK